MIDTGRIKEIEKDIAKIERDQKTSESKVDGYRERIRRLDIQNGEFNTRSTALREARQIALVNGEDSTSLTKELKGIDSEVEIIADELQGLQKAIAGIEANAETTTEQIAVLKREKATLTCVSLARQLNKELPKIAELLIEYDLALSQTMNYSAGGLVYRAGTHSEPVFSNVDLPILYIRGELDCPEGRLSSNEHVNNHHFISKFDNVFFRKNPGGTALHAGNTRNFKG